LGLSGGEFSASRPGRFTPGETVHGTHWIVGRVHTRAGLDDVEKKKSWPYWDSNWDPSVIQPLASRYIDWGIPAPINIRYNYFYVNFDYLVPGEFCSFILVAAGVTFHEVEFDSMQWCHADCLPKRMCVNYSNMFIRNTDTRVLSSVI
jgi:hypothetical protein